MTANLTAEQDRLRAALGQRYRLGDEIGSGGMAVVYRAHDTRLERDVALKVLRPELAAVLGTERFLREIAITASLHHPLILPLHDSGDAGGQPFYTMPYVAGESLRDRLEREKQLPVPDALGIAIDIADALSYAHAHGIVHRDVKPENILLAGPRAIVADFGIARALVAAGGERLSSAGLAIGTPAYMSPEQAAGSPEIDGRSDVYSLGCVLFEMLAGEPPFTGRTPQAVLARQVQERPPSLQVLRPALTGALLEAVGRSLAKVPADRFPTADAFAAALRAIAEGRAPSVAVPAARVPRGVIALVVLAAGLTLLGRWAAPRLRALDANRVVVFPVTEPAAPAGTGAAIATYVGYALEGSEPLRWEEGGEAGSAPPSVRAMRADARRRGAAWFIDGSVLRADSVTVVLRLHSVAGDSVVGRAARAGAAGTSEARLAVLAVADLLPRLLARGRAIDVTPLADRAPAAIANFLQGEREYAAADFARALGHYAEAVREDSLFALAAAKGAEAASWLNDVPRAAALAGVAARSARLLPRRYAVFVAGLEAYLAGGADTAVARFRETVSIAPDWADAWMALGDVYFHLLPSDPRPDTLALAAFEAAERSDPDFAPPLYHLAEIAARTGDAGRVSAYADRFVRVTRDSALATTLRLLAEGARGRLDSAAWSARYATAPEDALDAAVTLAQSDRFHRSGEAGLRAILGGPAGDDLAARSRRFGALRVLQARLAGDGRYGELRALLGSAAAQPLAGDFFFVSDAPAHPVLAPEAARVVGGMGTGYAAMRPVRLWLIAMWHATNGRPDSARAVAAFLAAKADSGQAPARQLADIVAAHASLAAGDTADAIRRLARLRPAGARADLKWGTWEPLGFERLTLARLLEARGDHDGALRVADALDSPVPASYAVYRPASLELRARAAAAAGRPERAGAYRARLP